MKEDWIYKRGDLYYANLNPYFGSEQGGTRPVLVLQNNVGNFFIGTIGYTDHKGINNQYVSEDKCIVENRRLIRRLTPLECERLQGFPDHWTDIPGASDSARYKALGNSVAIPCVDFVLRGKMCIRDRCIRRMLW